MRWINFVNVIWWRKYYGVAQYNSEWTKSITWLYYQNRRAPLFYNGSLVHITGFPSRLPLRVDTTARTNPPSSLEPGSVLCYHHWIPQRQSDWSYSCKVFSFTSKDSRGRKQTNRRIFGWAIPYTAQQILKKRIVTPLNIEFRLFLDGVSHIHVNRRYLCY